jgi:hypothetical protein
MGTIYRSYLENEEIDLSEISLKCRCAKSYELSSKMACDLR